MQLLREKSMIDLQNEQILTLSDASRLLPPSRRGRPVSFSCLWRWALRGIKNHTGEVVKLEVIKVGGRLLTSREALQRFAERLTPCVDGVAPAPPRTPAARNRAERAGNELAKIGI
jgi:hypothetical protein